MQQDLDYKIITSKPQLKKKKKIKAIVRRYISQSSLISSSSPF